jgi:hypothetical protein
MIIIAVRYDPDMLCVICCCDQGSASIGTSLQVHTSVHHYISIIVQIWCC